MKKLAYTVKVGHKDPKELTMITGLVLIASGLEVALGCGVGIIAIVRGLFD